MAGSDIRSQKLLYHLTSSHNLESIFARGLLPRAALKSFIDIADGEIISKRELAGLDRYVPFHWFARNPFDGIVQKKRPDEKFALIAVRRTLAEAENWRIIPQHPLSTESAELLDYAEGFEKIRWDLMNKREYADPQGKSVCMAECLSPRAVMREDFFKVFVAKDELAEEIAKFSGDAEIVVNRFMFNQ